MFPVENSYNLLGVVAVSVMPSPVLLETCLVCVMRVLCAFKVPQSPTLLVLLAS